MASLEDLSKVASTLEELSKLDAPPAPLTLAWRLDRASQGDSYLVMAAQMLEDGKDEGTTDAEMMDINRLAQTAVMMAQACYMAANIRVSEPKQPEPIIRHHPGQGKLV